MRPQARRTSGSRASALGLPRLVRRIGGHALVTAAFRTVGASLDAATNGLDAIGRCGPPLARGGGWCANAVGAASCGANFRAEAPARGTVALRSDVGCVTGAASAGRLTLRERPAVAERVLVLLNWPKFPAKGPGGGGNLIHGAATPRDRSDGPAVGPSAAVTANTPLGNGTCTTRGAAPLT
jgi:hypothetical protein